MLNTYHLNDEIKIRLQSAIKESRPTRMELMKISLAEFIHSMPETSVLIDKDHCDFDQLVQMPVLVGSAYGCPSEDAQWALVEVHSHVGLVGRPISCKGWLGLHVRKSGWIILLVPAALKSVAEYEFNAVQIGINNTVVPDSHADISFTEIR